MRLALHGGLFSGKSSLATELVARGFALVNYTDYLKELYARSLRAVGIDITKAEVIRNKEQERPHIISFGTRIGFDKGNFVEEALEDGCEWAYDDSLEDGDDGLPTDIVFDNVRFDTQMEKLLKYGFRLVRVNTPLGVRSARAAIKGLTMEQFMQRTSDPSEAPLSYFPGEISLSVDGEVDKIMQDLTAKLGMAQLTETLLKRAQDAHRAAS
jgi:hypothetical protein